MIQRIRNYLASLPSTTKSIILKLTMFVLLSFCLLFIFLSTQSTLSPTPTTTKTPYQTHLQSYQQTYAQSQSSYRQFAFYQTYDDLVFNQKQLDHKYKQAIEKISNVTQKEFQQMYQMVTAIAKEKQYQEIAQFQEDYFFDWAPFMPPVKDQRGYDGSHIFATLASVEFELNKQAALYLRQHNMPNNIGDSWITLSEQEVIDCCQSCTAKKQPKYVFTYMIKTGISSQKLYPYTSSIFSPLPSKCHSLSTPQFKIKNYYILSGCASLSQRLTVSPVVVHVDARQWRYYIGGILNSCGNDKNHYALAVGRGIGYWKIRNSWGPLWGEYGHIRLKSGNTCGICGRSYYANLN